MNQGRNDLLSPRGGEGERRHNALFGFERLFPFDRELAYEPSFSNQGFSGLGCDAGLLKSNWTFGGVSEPGVAVK